MSQGKGPRAGGRRDRRVSVDSSSSVLVVALLWLLVACGRTRLEPGSSEATPVGEGSGTAGARMRSAGGSPGAGGASSVGASGRSATVGGAGGEEQGVAGAGGFGGTPSGGLSGVAGLPAADAGTGGAALKLERCAPVLTPNLEGPAPFEFHSYPEAAVRGDWNGDGRLDLASANYDGTLSVVHGNGDGTFALFANYGTNLVSSNQISSLLATADLNHDGALDLVVARASPSVSVLLGRADGSFGPAVRYSVGGEVYSLSLGDFDADGATDIVVVRANSTGSAELDVLRGNGKGSFGSHVASLPLNGEAALGAGDFNGDGRLDLAAFSSWALTIAFGNGDGTFSAGSEYPGYLYGRSVVVADFDADGRADLALARGCGMEFMARGAVQLMRGNGDGTFSSTSYDLSGCPEHLEVGDVNGDGQLDLVTSATSVLLGSGAFGFTREVRSESAYAGNFLTTGDWNGDGKLDLATDYEHWLAVHLGNGDGSFGSVPRLFTGPETGSLVVADLDADGTLDLATSNYDSLHNGPSSVSVLRGLGDGSFAPHLEYPTGVSPHQLRARDLNGDGLLDLITLNHSETLGVLLGAGQGTFAPATEYPAGEHLNAFELGDLDGDGQLDAAAIESSPAQLSLSYGLGNGAFAAPVVVPLASGVSGLELLDANGDGVLDVALTGSGGRLDLLLGKGDGTFSAARSSPTVRDPGAIASGDFNEDGKPDLVISGWFDMSLHLGDGDGSFDERTDYAVRGGYLEVVDFDRDGHQDLILSGPGLQLLLGRGDGTFKCVEQYAPGFQINGVGSGDFNHDARRDIAVTSYRGAAVFLNSRR